ncbi:MAG: alginate O-acetyltransferase AlgX-related protein [bacterium]
MSNTQHENLETAEWTTAPLSRSKRLAFGGLLALLVLVVIELIGQLAYFLVVGEWLKNRAVLPIYRQAETPGEAHELRPNVNFENRSPEFNIKLVTNSQGFRVSQPSEITPPAKPEHEYRIMLFGPSFAFGAGVNYEDTWGKILGDLLQSHTEKSVSVINAGVPSLGDYHVLKRAQRLIPAYHPDLVVFIKYFPGITKYPPDTLRCTADGYLVPNEQYWVSYVKQSAIVYWLFQIKGALGSSSSHEKEFAAAEGKLASWFDSPHYQPWQAKFISEFERLAKDDSARLVMAYAPAQFEVHEDYLERWGHRYDFKGEALTQLKTFHTFMGQALENREILYVDLLPGMLAAAADHKTKLYFYLDVHWNAAGNKVVAEILASAIHHAGLMEP